MENNSLENRRVPHLIPWDVPIYSGRSRDGAVRLFRTVYNDRYPTTLELHISAWEGMTEETDVEWQILFQGVYAFRHLDQEWMWKRFSDHGLFINSEPDLMPEIDAEAYYRPKPWIQYTIITYDYYLDIVARSANIERVADIDEDPHKREGNRNAT